MTQEGASPLISCADDAMRLIRFSQLDQVSLLPSARDWGHIRGRLRGEQADSAHSSCAIPQSFRPPSGFTDDLYKFAKSYKGYLNHATKELVANVEKVCCQCSEGLGFRVRVGWPSRVPAKAKPIYVSVPCDSSNMLCVGMLVCVRAAAYTLGTRPHTRTHAYTHTHGALSLVD